ncbi:MAG: LPS assembly protein LptD [Candidatus Omnitrophica bacterium]|nr:LPS assembly protein LptD [Candidatus Omnitrophota bacterium]
MGDAEVDRHWSEVKQLLRQGAYRDALQSLEVLLQRAPNDPRAQLYRALCELRLESPPPFTQLSPAELGTLQGRLRAEEREQRRAHAQQKALERQVKHEQARWDRELGALEQQAKREEQAQRRQAPAPPEAPAARIELAAPGPMPEGSVKLAPVTVTTTPDEAPEGPPVTPSLVGRPAPPPGAVQINARQMSVSPDRKVAVADGDVEVVFENALLTCDHLTLFTDTKDVYAEGRVRLEDGQQVFRGEMAHYNFNTKKGRFLQGTISSPPWHEHGRSVEHLAEGVYAVTPGYLTSCELEPPHFKFFGRRAVVFADDKLARVRNAAFIVERVPFLYLPWITVADRQSPFFIIPGKKKPWEQFALMGYRYELPGPIEQKGTLKLDWRRAFGWGVGADHTFDSERFGRGLLKLYYNEEPNRRRPIADLPKGSRINRYRLLWRHKWQPYPDTTVLTDIQEFSDIDFRRELLFREEFSEDDQVDSFISAVKNTDDFTVSGLVRKRMNRFQAADEALPQLTVDVRPQRIGETWFFSESRLDFANFERKRAHSELDDDVVRVDWFQQLSYALNWFRPIQLTPKAGVRQTYYTKDIQGSSRHDGNRDLLSGQFSAGIDSSLKLFRIFPVKTNALGLDINLLRHVLTPAVNYAYVHEPTVLNDLLNFSAAPGPSSTLSFSVENKLQTKRVLAEGHAPTSVDLARFIATLPPYTFQGSGNKRGGELGDWGFDVETYPWPWMRLETDWTVNSHFIDGTQDSRPQRWNMDLILVGGQGALKAQEAHEIQAPSPQAFETGPRGGLELLPQGQWYLGYGHRYSRNDKTEDVLQFDWRLSPKWQIGTFHRFTWKEVVSGSKRFNNVREYQYSLRRDLHDWIGELVYRVDREFGEELFLTLTLKAYPELPIEISDSYHQPKIGSQSSPFSPVR